MSTAPDEDPTAAPRDATDDDVDPARPHHRFREAGRVIRDAAEEAERDTGEQEETEEEARRGVTARTARALGGFLVVGIGIALLPLPGPGWLMIILGLSLLPYAWAERTILSIRRRIPGIPDDGAVPRTTWVLLGISAVTFTAASILFGRQIGQWLGDVWTGLWD